MRVRLLAVTRLLTGLVAALSFAQLAAAQGVAPVSVTWDAPPSCGDAKTIETEGQRLLGATTVTAEKRVVARAKVIPAGRGAVRVNLTTERAGVHGVRTVDAASCRAATESTALILALTIDPAQVAARSAASGSAPVVAPVPGTSVAPAPTGTPPTTGAPSTTAPHATVDPTAPPRATPPQGTPPQGTPPSVSPVESSAAQAAPPPAASSAARAKPPATRDARPATTVIAISAFGIGDLGSLPKPSLGIGGAIAWTPGRGRIEAGAVSFPGSTASVTPDGSRGGRFQLALAQLRACYTVVQAGIFGVAPCAVGEVGSMAGKGYGVETPGSGTALFAAAGPGVLGSLRLGDAFALRLAADLELIFTQAQFVLDQVGAVHQPSVFAGRASLGAEIRF